jgi:hypothetical protein
MGTTASIHTTVLGDRPAPTNGRAHTRCCRQRSWNTAVQCAGPRCQPSTRGRSSSDLHGPPAAIHKRRQGATPEYVQWARTAPHVITHIATLWRRPHADSDVLWARETHRTTPHTHHTDLLLVWNEAARVQSKHPVSSARGVYRQRQEPAVTTHPTHTTSRRCHGPPGVGGNQRFSPARGAPCTPHGAA